VKEAEWGGRDLLDLCDEFLYSHHLACNVQLYEMTGSDVLRCSLLIHFTSCYGNRDKLRQYEPVLAYKASLYLIYVTNFCILIT